MTHHVIHMPCDEAAVRALHVGDTVTLEDWLFGIRDATQIAMFDQGRNVRLDLKGHAVVHTAPNVKRVPPSPEAPVGYAPLCIGTTTSMRMERFIEPLLRDHGVRLIIGKGGLGPASTAAFKRYGGAYLAVVGGAAALETTWITEITDVDLDDLNPESLWKFRVKGFGPLLVAMDSHGGSLYASVGERVADRRAAALAALGASE
jgi:L(+)-tartrate dehydratase beta subunit